MKSYEILDEENRISIGILLYYEKVHTWIIELQDNLDEWSAPLLFTKLVSERVYTMPAEISRMWVEERVIPSGRQNIGSILTANRLKRYDEMRFLELSNGRCSQDSLAIRRIDSLPDYVQERMKRNLSECFVTGCNLFCFFNDGTVRKINLSDMNAAEGVSKILQNPQLMNSGKVGVGGYSVNFGEAIDLPARILYESGQALPLSLSDFLEFTRKNVLDTSETCAELECSRQNLAYLQDKQFVPVKQNVRGNLYLKGEILKNRW